MHWEESVECLRVYVYVNGARENAQVDDDLGIDVALDAGISVAHHVVPDAAIAALGYQLLPPRAPKGELALLGAELHDGIEKGQVEAPDLDAGAARGGCDGRIGGELGILGVVSVGLGRRRDDGLDGGQGLGQATGDEQVGGLAVCFCDLLRVLARGRQRRDRGAQRARAAEVLVHGRHGG